MINSAPSTEHELTARAVFMGLGIGIVLAVANLYMGLKTGWWDSGMITASILGFALATAARRLSPLRYSRLENNVTQTTAAAVAAMPSAVGLLGAMPALDLMGTPTAPWVLLCWGLALGLFGVALAVPMRARYVDGAKLPFPSAVATHEVIDAMHAQTASSASRPRALLGGGLVAMVVTWFRDGKPAVVPGSTWFPFSLGGLSAESLTLGVTVSPMLLCVGGLVGLRVGLSLLVGAALGWSVVAPALIHQGLATADYASCVKWLIWPGVTLMAASSFTSLLFQWADLLKMLKARRAEANTQPTAPMSRASRGAIAATGVLLVVLAWGFFDVNPIVGTLTVVASVALIDLCVTITGNSDVAPYGPLGQLMQILLGILVPGAPVTNIVGASVSSGAAAETVQMLYAYKVGAHLKSSPRSLVIAQLLGVVTGACVVVPVYAVISRAYGLGTAALPAPFVLGWKAFAEVTQRGAMSLPPFAGQACVAALVAGALMAVAERRFPTRAPSAIGVGLAFLLPAANALTIALGAVAAAVLTVRAPKWSQQSLASLAAGGIAGESIIGVLTAALTILGWL